MHPVRVSRLPTGTMRSVRRNTVNRELHVWCDMPNATSTSSHVALGTVSKYRRMRCSFFAVFVRFLAATEKAMPGGWEMSFISSDDFLFPFPAPVWSPV